MVETSSLLRNHTHTGYRGFESLRLRHLPPALVSEYFGFPVSPSLRGFPAQRSSLSFVSAERFARFSPYSAQQSLGLMKKVGFPCSGANNRENRIFQAILSEITTISAIGARNWLMNTGACLSGEPVSLLLGKQGIQLSRTGN